MDADKILKKLDDYFKNTPKEEIDKEIEKINKMVTEDGIDVDEFFKMHPLTKEILNQNK